MDLRPDLRVDRIVDVDASILRRLGVEGVLLDLDETLLPAHAERPDASVIAWAHALRDAGFRLAILSNGTRTRVSRTAAELGVPGIPLAGKPWPFAFRRGLATLGLPAKRVAAIGDQVFTDVLGARWSGIKAILVPPLSSGGMPHTRVLRRIEARILRGGERGCIVHR